MKKRKGGGCIRVKLLGIAPMIHLFANGTSRHIRAGRRSFFLFCTLWIVAGCGNRQGEVSGTVSYGGKPLQNGTVSFFDQNNNVVGTSSIADGKNTIRKVPPGAVKITVAADAASPPIPPGAKDMP